VLKARSIAAQAKGLGNRIRNTDEGWRPDPSAWMPSKIDRAFSPSSCWTPQTWALAQAAMDRAFGAEDPGFVPPSLRSARFIEKIA